MLPCFPPPFVEDPCDSLGPTQQSKITSHLKVINLLASSKSSLLCEVTYSQVPGLGCGHSGGSIIILRQGPLEPRAYCHHFTNEHPRKGREGTCLEPTSKSVAVPKVPPQAPKLSVPFVSPPKARRTERPLLRTLPGLGNPSDETDSLHLAGECPSGAQTFRLRRAGSVLRRSHQEQEPKNVYSVSLETIR